MRIRKLTIIVPVYNEIATVEKVIRKLSKLSLGKTKKEVIVVDDGSTDGTTQLLKKLEKRGTHFKYLFHLRNVGKGAAIRTGLIQATGDYVIIQDADLEYNPEEIIKLVKRAENDSLWVVFGSRDKDIKNKYLYPHYYWGSRLLCLLINLAFGMKYTDPETCYKLMKTNLWRFLDMEERGFGVEIEVATKVARLKVPWGEVSVSYQPRNFAQGKKIGVKDGLKAIWLIVKYRMNDLHYGVVDQWLREIRYKAALKYIRLGEKETVVDMGCGRQAKFGWWLREKIWRYIGLDKEIINLQIENLELVKADLDRLPKSLRTKADKIVGTAILEHLRQPEMFLRECRQILKPKGQLVLTTPTPPLAGLVLRLLAVMGMIKADEVQDHISYYGLGELMELVGRAGFRVVKAERFLLGLNSLVVAKKL
jgi:glycosyltransferase involved in cell wall biosynthesis